MRRICARVFRVSLYLYVCVSEADFHFKIIFHFIKLYTLIYSLFLYLIGTQTFQDTFRFPTKCDF